MERETQKRDDLGQVIVVAVDLTEASDSAVLAGVRITRPGDTLLIAHTVQSRRVGEVQRIVEEEKLLESDPVEVRDYFRAVCVGAGDWPAATPRFRTVIGSPVEAILQCTVDEEAHILICGTHARHGLDRLLHGSVAEVLVREARCPVLVAKPRSYASARKSDRPVPLCADCVAMRQQKADPMVWCEVHAREHFAPHTYGPSELRGSHPASFNIPT
ncbi:MAG: universal stress protein [Sandaracinaceae bacterium]|nr:universal stress protein [Sandaracinaceae bacterium]